MSGRWKRNISFTANGASLSLEVDVRDTLLDALRDGIGLTGTKKGCDEGVCGACSVLLDGRAVCSCSMLAVEAQGSSVVTIEGLGKDGEDRLQLSFIAHDAMQCGFCTPGQIIAARSFLDSTGADLTAEGIKNALSGNICRCGCYANIIEAVLAAARGGGGEP